MFSVPEFSPNEPEHLKAERERALLRIQELMRRDDLSIFNFATSSLGGVPIQAVVMTNIAQVLLVTCIQTNLELDPDSQRFHGLSRTQVDDGQRLEQIMPTLREYLDESNTVITFTPDFMSKALARGCRETGVDMMGTTHWISAQELLAPLVGTYNWTTNRWSKPKLTDCIRDLAVPADFAPIGTAMGNTQRLWFVLNHYAQGLNLPAIEHCERCGEVLEHCTCGMDLPAGEPF